jgi:antitoxin MazE5
MLLRSWSSFEILVSRGIVLRSLRQAEWHNDGMNRIRLSTTVDAELLGSARSVRSGITDAALIDEALAALLAHYRSAEVDASYAAYDEHPVEQPDEWGDLASWRQAAGAS